ncbi:hypothetical protein [Streptomyces sp. NPDC018055]|uniref:hypothetical protein n=1 Tax=Streptomyces sp. NPDC018055 TaxID=3365038 RepID=UPI0037A28B37
MSDEHPPRVVDREGEGWLRNGSNGTYTTYPRNDIGDELTYEQLIVERGPVRPVGLMGEADSDALVEALLAAKKKAVATLLVALNRTARTLIDDGASVAVFTSGRPGSWEASLFRGEILWLGEDIAVNRIDGPALDIARAILLKWVTGPVQPELAEGLAFLLGSVAEKAGSWAAITDRWLATSEPLERWTASYRLTNQPFGVAES